MKKQLQLPKFWSSDQPRWNFGDALSVLVFSELLVDFIPYKTRPWTIGSVLMDGAASLQRERDNASLPSFIEGVDCQAVFWGCGVRGTQEVSEQFLDVIAVLSARGPCSASALRAGASLPLGDPGLFLPALYQPRKVPELAGKSVCVPHYLDSRSDDEILSASGCDKVLRVALAPNRNAIYAFIDAATSADFLLCGALHAAIIGAAYGCKFGFWQSGMVDVIPKWEDFSALVGIDCDFHETVNLAQRHYEDVTAKKIVLPNLWPMLCVAPAFVRPGGLLKVLQFEAQRSGVDTDAFIKECIAELQSHQPVFDRLVSLSREAVDEVIPELADKVAQLTNALMDAEQRLSEAAAIHEDLRRQLGEERATTAAAIAARNEAVHLNEMTAQRLSIVEADAERRLGEAAAIHEDLRRQLDEERAVSADAIRQVGAEAIRIQFLRDEIDLVRTEAQGTVERLETTVTLIGRTVTRIRNNKWVTSLRKLPIVRRYDQDLTRQQQKISEFLSRFDDNQLGMSHEGREDRILAYLLKLTSSVPDFPLFDRSLYTAMHPDVTSFRGDAFIHYLEYGNHEGRSPHPLLDVNYYAGRYPETSCFEFSALEHFIRFGAAKGYDPCELFCVSDYYSQYPDVKSSGYNPVIHYLRHPGCQPHRDFDSYGYQIANPDVVRARINPLSHYLIWGKSEGRSTVKSHTEQPTLNRVISSTAIMAGKVENVPSVQVDVIEPVRSARPIIVMVDAFYPQPDKDSGSLDQVNFARIFQNLGYEVAFASLIDFAPQHKTKQPLAQLGVTCVTGEEYRNLEEYVFLNAEKIHAFFLSRFNFGGTWIDKARRLCPDAQIIFNTVDLHHVREEREAQLKDDMEALAKASLTREQELACIDAADVTIVVSEAELALLDEILPSADVRVVPLIRGVRSRARPGFEARDGIAFVGGFQHQPNIDAVTHFLDEVWPMVLARLPNLTLYVIGSHMPLQLSSRLDSNVEWIGYVPELEPWLDRVLATVAPLRYGAGAKGKVVSSLINGVPCVASTIAAEGMNIAAGDGILIAENSRAFVDRIADITTDAGLWQSTSRQGFDTVARLYSLDRGVELIGQIVSRVAAE
ncbi:MAG: glycosyltransferase [Sphingobium sp.]|jgi:hypothetical protein|nr:glycosyltransferase [Sphingobium sp.]